MSAQCRMRQHAWQLHVYVQTVLLQERGRVPGCRRMQPYSRERQSLWKLSEAQVRIFQYLTVCTFIEAYHMVNEQPMKIDYFATANPN